MWVVFIVHLFLWSYGRIGVSNSYRATDNFLARLMRRLGCIIITAPDIKVPFILALKEVEIAYFT